MQTVLGNKGSTPISTVIPVVQGEFGNKLSIQECEDAFSLLSSKANVLYAKSTTQGKKVFLTARSVGVTPTEYHYEKLTRVV